MEWTHEELEWFLVGMAEETGMEMCASIQQARVTLTRTRKLPWWKRVQQLVKSKTCNECCSLLFKGTAHRVPFSTILLVLPQTEEAIEIEINSSTTAACSKGSEGWSDDASSETPIET